MQKKRTQQEIATARHFLEKIKKDLWGNQSHYADEAVQEVWLTLTTEVKFGICQAAGVRYAPDFLTMSLNEKSIVWLVLIDLQKKLEPAREALKIKQQAAVNHLKKWKQDHEQGGLDL